MTAGPRPLRLLALTVPWSKETRGALEAVEAVDVVAAVVVVVDTGSAAVAAAGGMVVDMEAVGMVSAAVEVVEEAEDVGEGMAVAEGMVAEVMVAEATVAEATAAEPEAVVELVITVGNPVIWRGIAAMVAVVVEGLAAAAEQAAGVVDRVILAGSRGILLENALRVL